MVTWIAEKAMPARRNGNARDTHTYTTLHTYCHINTYRDSDGAKDTQKESRLLN